MEENTTTPTVQAAPANTVIHQTTDYTKFNYIDSNRVVNKAHVQKIIRSMEKHPELIPVHPILVNENFEIIDGQHRLQALMALHLPVHYQVASGTTIEDAQVMNAMQRGWNLMDFARSYAKNGRVNYQKFLELHEEFNLPPSLLIAVMTSRTRKRMSAAFREGSFDIKDMTDIRQTLAQFESLGDFVPFYKEINFANAYLSILKTPGFDHQQMLRKLELKKPQRQGSRREYLRELEDVYNWKQSEETRLRFYA